jgi:protein-disulfide isomerase
MIGGIVLIAVAVVAVAIAISSGGGGSGLKTGASASKTASAVEQLLSGVPQSGAVLGNPKAPVTMSYYGDLQCPTCDAFTLDGGFPQLIQNDVRAGTVKVVFRGVLTATGDQATFQRQQVAALAAGKQRRFWDFVELFYHEQGVEGSGYATESYLDGLGRQIPGLDRTAWKTARTDPTLLSQVQADEQSASAQGIASTPTLIFQGPKGKAQPSAAVPTYSDLQQAIKRVS